MIIQKKRIIDSHISVPIEMFINAQEKKYGRELRFFLLLKLMYRVGKIKFTSEELDFIDFVEQIKSRKTTKKYIKLLEGLNWIKYNHKTKYYILNSFDKIRKDNEWLVRLAFPIDYNTYYNIEAVTGAVIYGYLHKDFWRKVKRDKSVLLKKSTYYFISPKFNYKQKPAPVSVLGVSRIFNISSSTASRLKKYAKKEKLIKVHKNYWDEEIDQEEVKFAKEYFPDEIKYKNLVFKDKKYRLQLIDTIYPLFYFTKRKSLET